MDVMTQRSQLDSTRIRSAVVDCAVLAIACLASYLLTTRLLSRLYSASKADDLLGGMWAIIATIFVIRDSYQKSLSAAASRMSATAVSFVICLIYLVFFSFNSWTLPILIGISALAVTLLGQPDAAITAAITTAVIMVVAAVSPQDAWREPILRFADTAIGVAVGIIFAWIALRLIRPRIDPAS
jgi:uncharacterized membrane protein YgaE (UPF0421/DUF939 family)